VRRVGKQSPLLNISLGLAENESEKCGFFRRVRGLDKHRKSPLFCHCEESPVRGTTKQSPTNGTGNRDCFATPCTKRCRATLAMTVILYLCGAGRAIGRSRQRRESPAYLFPAFGGMFHLSHPYSSFIFGSDKSDPYSSTPFSVDILPLWIYYSIELPQVPIT
jgi:hypothetical protein